MNGQRIAECTELASEILKNFELSELPIENIIFKCLRLCRLLGDTDGIKLFTYESSGYPLTDDGVLTGEVARIAELAGRKSVWSVGKSGSINNKPSISLQLISSAVNLVETLKLQLGSAGDPSVSVASANPRQMVFPHQGNAMERLNAVYAIRENQTLINKVTGSLYSYILGVYNKLAYGNVIEDAFTKARIVVNEKLSTICPEAIGKFVAVYDNMDSENPEDWANAVHSCRRILMDVADALCPVEIAKKLAGVRDIKVDQEKYINRLCLFAESKSSSKTFGKVVGKDLASLGERIEAIYESVCKGTHNELGKEEATRYIIHTYFLISDLLYLEDSE